VDAAAVDRGKGGGRALAAERTALTSGLLAAFAGGYFGTAAWTAGAPVHSVQLPVDDAIPLWIPSVWMYTTAYTAMLLPLFVEPSNARLRRVALAYAGVLAFSFAVHALYPVSAASLRPPVAGEGASAWLLRLLYALDPPRNCLPSVHVALAAVAASVVARRVPGAAVLAWGWWAALAVSTTTTRQHFVLDVVAGAVLGAVAAWWLARRAHPKVPGDGPGGWAGLGRYALLHAGCVAAALAAHRLGLV